MSDGLVLPLPTPRTLQGWWRDLAGLGPRRLWFGRVFFHHVDALVETANATPLDPLQRALLHAIITTGVPPPALDPQFRARLLAELTRNRLVTADGQVTDAGRSAVATGTYGQASRSRRAFRFADHSDVGRPPSYLHLNKPLPAITAPNTWTFPSETLTACVRQSPEWKQRHHFPPDIRAVVDLASAPGDWRAVMLDRAEQFVGVFVEAEGLTAYTVRVDSWVLECHSPAFSVTEDWQEVLPELAVEPSPEEWRQSWLEWCQPRGITPDEAASCTLDRDGLRLVLRGPTSLLERLRTARGEPLTNEPWLLAGTGRIRAAALLALAQS